MRCIGEGAIVPSASPYDDCSSASGRCAARTVLPTTDPDLKIRGLEVLSDSTGAQNQIHCCGAAHASPDDSLQKIVTPIPLYREIYMDIGDLNLVFLTGSEAAQWFFTTTQFG